MSLKTSKIILIGILFLSIFLRVYKINSVPTELYIDEVAMFVDVQSIVHTAHDLHAESWYQLIFPSYGDYKMPVYIWLAALFGKFFGVSILTLKLPTIIAGVVTSLLGYYLSLELFAFFAKNKNVLDKESATLMHTLGVCVALIVAISPWSFLFSRAAFEGHLAQAFFCSSILLQLISIRRGSKLFLFFSVLMGVLATYTYYSVRFVWPEVFLALWTIYFGYEFHKKFKIPFKAFFQVLLGIIFYFSLLLPLQKSPYYSAMNFIRLNTDSVLKAREDLPQINHARLLAGNTFFDRLYLNAEVFTLRDLLKNYSDNLSLQFLFLTGDPNLRHSTGHHGVFLLPMSILLLVGVVTLVRENKMLALFLSFWILVAFLPASVPENTPHALRSLNALLPFAVIIGWGMAIVIVRYLMGKAKLYFYGASILLLWLFIASVEFFYFYFVEYPKLSRGAWYTEFSQVAENIESLRRGTEAVYVANVKDTFFLWMYYKGTYIQNGTTQTQASGFIHEKFADVRIGTLPDEPKSGDIVATSEESWSKFTKKFPQYGTGEVRTITADDGSIFIVSRLP